MKRISIQFLFLFAASLLLSSCSGTAESKLIGTWKAQKVETDFNEAKFTPDMIDQVVEMQKQTYFRMVNDSVLTIISKNDTHEAQWKYDPESNKITYYFNGLNGMPGILGIWKDGTIVSESKTPLGKITITYEKE